MVGFILPDGVVGDAVFSDDGVYRHLLTRQRKEDYKKILLWVGLFPTSVANAKEDDKTIQIETAATWRRKYWCYARVNVCDLVAHRPQNLIASSAPCSKVNMKAIRRIANDPRTKEIVLATGVFKTELRHYIRTTIEILKETRKPILCVGTNADGSPKSVLYAARDAELTPWKEVLV